MVLTRLEASTALAKSQETLALAKSRERVVLIKSWESVVLLRSRECGTDKVLGEHGSGKVSSDHGTFRVTEECRRPVWIWILEPDLKQWAPGTGWRYMSEVASSVIEDDMSADKSCTGVTGKLAFFALRFKLFL